MTGQEEVLASPRVAPACTHATACALLHCAGPVQSLLAVRLKRHTDPELVQRPSFPDVVPRAGKHGHARHGMHRSLLRAARPMPRVARRLLAASHACRVAMPRAERVRREDRGASATVVHAQSVGAAEADPTTLARARHVRTAARCATTSSYPVRRGISSASRAAWYLEHAHTLHAPTQARAHPAPHALRAYAQTFVHARMRRWAGPGAAFSCRNAEPPRRHVADDPPRGWRRGQGPSESGRRTAARLPRQRADCAQAHPE